MYLAKVHIAPGKAANPYEVHRALWQLFPGRADEKRQFLFRVEQNSRQFGAQVLMQTELEPVSQAKDAHCLMVKPVKYRLSEGQQLRFRLRANPIKCIKDQNKGTVSRKGKTYVKTVKVPLIDYEQQQCWLERKLASSGARLLAANIVQEPPVYFRKGKEKRSGKIQPVLFEGILQVSNPKLLEQTLLFGIGSAKSFGMGLLSLAAA